MRRPSEFADRAAGLLDRLTDSSEASTTLPISAAATWDFLAETLGADVQAALREPMLLQTDAVLSSRIASLPAGATFGASNCVERLLGHVIYVICRVLRPTTVVETGVAYGSSSAYLLAALATNQHGVLHSIDLPSILDPEARLVGAFVPHTLRERWHLHLGASRRLLRGILEAVEPVDMFLHDSLHTKRNMLWEFTSVAPHLADRAVVVSDDVDRNRAFEDWARREGPRWAHVQQVERSGAMGIAVFGLDG